jgi:hypothetical protein
MVSPRGRRESVSAGIITRRLPPAERQTSRRSCDRASLYAWGGHLRASTVTSDHL